MVGRGQGTWPAFLVTVLGMPGVDVISDVMIASGNPAIQLAGLILQAVRLAEHERGVDSAILQEHKPGVDAARQEYWKQGLKQGRSRTGKQFAKENFHDIGDLEQRYHEAKR